MEQKEQINQIVTKVVPQYDVKALLDRMLGKK